jgi:O-antigen ligase
MWFGLFKIIAVISVLLFFIYLFFYKADKNQFYIKYILIAYPFLNSYPFPILKGFGLISILFFIFFYRPTKIEYKFANVYRVLVFCFLIVATIGIFVCDLGVTWDTLPHYLAIFPIFIFCKILIECFIEDYDFFYEIISLIKYLMVFSFIFLLLQFKFGVEFSISKSLNPNIFITDGIRYPSFLTDPQDFSGFLAMTSFLCLIKRDDQEKISPLNYLFVILAVLGMMTAGGRAGLMGFIAGLLLVLIFSKSKYKFYVIGFGIAFYFIIMNFQSSFSIFKRGTDLDETYQFRHTIWEQAFDMFLKNPFFGIGLGNYQRYVAIHNPDQVWISGTEIIPFDIPESGYLKILSELGATGFVAAFSIILLPIIRGAITFLKTRDFTLILLLGALSTWFVGFNSNYSFADNRILILFGTLISMLIYRQIYLTEMEVNIEEEEQVTNF